MWSSASFYLFWKLSSVLYFFQINNRTPEIRNTLLHLPIMALGIQNSHCFFHWVRKDVSKGLSCLESISAWQRQDVSEEQRYWYIFFLPLNPTNPGTRNKCQPCIWLLHKIQTLPKLISLHPCFKTVNKLLLLLLPVEVLYNGRCCSIVSLYQYKSMFSCLWQHKRLCNQR